MTTKFVPESVHEKLVVGARIRYIPNYECSKKPDPYSAAASYGAEGHESQLDAEQKIGTILSTSYLKFKGHPYKVKMDIPYRFGGREFNVVELAVDELALVEEGGE